MAIQAGPLNPEQVNIEDLGGNDVLVTRRGFKLQVVAVPADIVQKARERIPRPQAPLVPDKEKPGQVFENMLDPKYNHEMEAYNRVYNELTFRVMASYGVKAYGIPPGYYPPESDEWVKDLQNEDIFLVEGQNYAVQDIPAVDRPKARFYSWLRYHVLSQEDLQPFWDAVVRGTGTILEKDVEEAIDSFPGGDGGPSSNGTRKSAKER